jgi:hypothetical protein
MVCPKTNSNSKKKKIVEEAGEKRMKLRAKLRKGSTTCQMGGWMDRHWGGGREVVGGKAGEKIGGTYLVLRESEKLIAAVFKKSTFIMEGQKSRSGSGAFWLTAV